MMPPVNPSPWAQGAGNCLISGQGMASFHLAIFT